MKIFGITLNKLKYTVFLKNITSFEKQNIIFTPNPEILLKSLEDNDFNKLLKKADYLTLDGTGLYIALQILNSSIKSKILQFILLPYYFFNFFFRRKFLYNKYGDRICGSDLTKDLLIFAENKKIKITIIDLYNPTDFKKIESQKIFQNKLKNKFPKLDFDYFIYNTEKKDEIINNIKSSKSKILFSTLGMKKQEESVIKIIEKCKNIKIGLGVGSSFDYLIGFQKRAPKIFRILGIEWFYRIFTGPKKLQRLKRIYNAIFVFLYKVIITPPPSGTPLDTNGRLYGKIKLEFPELKHKKAYEDMISEWKKHENLSDISPFALFVGNNFEEFLEITKKEVYESSWGVTSHLFFLVDGDKILGGIHLRHHINHPNLINTGGHIGYGIFPTERKKGYATIMLKLGLIETKKLGINEVLITCDDSNIASIKVIEKNGGIFESIALKNGTKMRRYWIKS